MARKSPLVAIGTQCRQRPGECTRRATGATRYRRLAARAEPSGGFAGGAPSVAGFEELAPEKLDAIELHAPMRFLVGTHGVDARRVLLGSGLPRRFRKEREAPCVLLLYAGG